MFSLIRTVWLVLLHAFHRRVTILYPEQKPVLHPRWRGRIILSRDPDGGERCVACYLCAVACPVDCIALEATQDEHGRRYPEWFRINFSRCIFCGFCEEACPTYAIQLTPDFEMSEYDRPNLVYEKARPADQRAGQVPRLQLLPGGRTGHRRKGQRPGRGRDAARGSSHSVAVSACGLHDCGLAPHPESAIHNPKSAIDEAYDHRLLHLGRDRRRGDHSGHRAGQRRAFAAVLHLLAAGYGRDVLRPRGAVRRGAGRHHQRRGDHGAVRVRHHDAEPRAPVGGPGKSPAQAPRVDRPGAAVPSAADRAGLQSRTLPGGRDRRTEWWGRTRWVSLCSVLTCWPSSWRPCSCWRASWAPTISAGEWSSRWKGNRDGDNPCGGRVHRGRSAVPDGPDRGPGAAQCHLHPAGHRDHAQRGGARVCRGRRVTGGSRTARSCTSSC